MNKDTKIWTIVFMVGLVLLVIRSFMVGGLFGTAYVSVEQMEYAEVSGGVGEENWVNINSEEALDFDLTQAPDRITWTKFEQASPKQFDEAVLADPNQDSYRFSLPRTVGLWLAVFFTMAIFSFLYKDNPFYKIAESVVVGVSAAYWMVVGFWNVMIPNLFGMINSNLVNGWAMPGLADDESHYIYLIPLILGIMLLMRLSPKGAWISRWPLAFIIGTTAGIRLLGFFHGDFLAQIRNSIAPIYSTTPQLAADGTAILDAATGLPVMGFDFWDSMRNILMIVGVLSCLVYFFFSFEHKGAVGKVAKLGIWYMMITFGAAFGFTVMGRIALLSIRLEFLFDDWLWLIDPTGKRLADTVGIIMSSVPMLS
ncbi:MAG: hypothetical protein O7G85_12535 [Planctomycetota bacterium]|nr:hypothetical protein [Planctomycetota bacterium]